jgi:hypothetical protein
MRQEITFAVVELNNGTLQARQGNEVAAADR